MAATYLYVLAHTLKERLEWKSRDNLKKQTLGYHIQIRHGMSQGAPPVQNKQKQKQKRKQKQKKKKKKTNNNNNNEKKKHKKKQHNNNKKDDI